MNETELFEKYKQWQKLLNETRALDVNELVDFYKTKILKLIKQKVYNFLDLLWDGKPVPKVMKIHIPNLMAPTTFRKEPVRMKGLLVKIYFDTNRLRDDYTKEKGPGMGTMYANASGDTNPGFEGELDPVPLMMNLPQIYGKNYCKRVKGGYVLEFADMVDDFGTVNDTPEEIVEAIMDEYFRDYFAEVLTHELTHFVQSNNYYLDGTENAREYDAAEVLRNGQYLIDTLEVEARLHQKMPAYVDAILRAKNITPIAKTITDNLFMKKMKSAPRDIQQKYFNMVLRLCQAVKSIPGITRYNYNTPKMRRMLHDKI